MIEKFTRGPWAVIEHSWSHTGIYAGDKAIAGLNIADEATEENEAELSAEMLANARLIAAAPELYEALRLAGQSPGFQYMTYETRAAIDAAIAKATGA